jgi:hypothetical protein
VIFDPCGVRQVDVCFITPVIPEVKYVKHLRRFEPGWLNRKKTGLGVIV